MFWELKLPSNLRIKLKKIRKDQGFTLDSLAKAAGLSKSYLWELENRDNTKPSAEKLSSIANVLGVSVNFFLDGDNVDPDEKQKDEAFFRNYERLDPDAKDQLRKILDTFKKD